MNACRDCDGLGCEECRPSPYNATIQERGNGFPDVGDYVPGDDGELYRVERMSRIHTGDSMRSDSNYVYAVVELADWRDCPEEDEGPGQVVLRTGGGQ